MSLIERVMKAYASKHDLNPEQARLVRTELSRFVQELTAAKPQEPTPGAQPDAAERSMALPR